MKEKKDERKRTKKKKEKRDELCSFRLVKLKSI